MTTDIDAAFFPFLRPEIPTPPRTQQLPADQWIKHRKIIEDLYINQDKTLDELVATMKQEHSFYATPRQFTQKFRYWRLHKNARRKAERKPRGAASIYRNGTGSVGGQQSPNSVTRMVTRGVTLTSPDNESSNRRHADIGVQLAWNLEETFLPNQTSSMNSAGKSGVTADGLGEAMQPGLATGSSAITAEDNSKISVNIVALLQRSGRPSEAIILPKGDLDRTVSDNAPSDSHHRGHLISLELTQQIPSGLEYSRDMLENLQNEREKKTQSSLTLAIWKMWHDGDFSQIESLFNVVEYCHPLGIDIATIYGIDLDLREWTHSYPWPRRNLQSEGHLPLFHLDFRGTPILTWRVYAEHGYIIASLKRGMTHVKCQAYVSRATGRLVAAMLQDPSRSRTLRRLFLKTFIELEPVLLHLSNHLQTPCQRFASHFPFRTSGSEDQNSTGHGEQRREAVMLALACHRELKARMRYSILAAMSASIQSQVSSSVEQALVWAARLLLYYASPELAQSPLPHDLCARALDGCRQVLNKTNCALYSTTLGSTGDSGTDPVSDHLEGAKFAPVWAEWICCDSDFFLYDD